MELEFISLIDQTDRTSSLLVDKKINKLVVVGELPHRSEIVPKSLEDCDKLIAFLKEWRKTQI